MGQDGTLEVGLMVRGGRGLLGITGGGDEGGGRVWEDLSRGNEMIVVRSGILRLGLC